MKIGLRKPSPKKSFKAMTTGKIKRKIKKTIIPGYGKKGTGLFKNPKKAIYNKVYHKTTFGIKDLAKTKRKKTSKNKDSNLIVDIFVWLFVISFFIAILPFYLIYHIIFKKK
jgi:conserved hypothetical protein|nr:MAG TPA: hypothetical protein [Caudoviricetes sp.]